MSVDPDTYPTPEEEWEDALDDAEDLAPDTEWRPGECDMCAGHSSQAEQRAAMASAIIPVCACAIGQGAPLGQCLCGPELFPAEPSTEEQPPAPAAEATVHTVTLAPDNTTVPDWWTNYVDRKTDELITSLFGPLINDFPEDMRAGVRTAVANHVSQIMREMSVHLTVPH